MILNHFTAAHNLRGIARYGLTVGDVPTDIARWRGRVGVWLTSDAAPDGHGLEGSALDKTRYRLAVNTASLGPLLAKWSDWAPRNVTPQTIKALHSTASGSDSWYVCLGIVPAAAIVSCLDMVTMQEVPNWPEHVPVEHSHAGVPAWRREAWLRQTIKGAAKAAQRRQAALSFAA